MKSLCCNALIVFSQPFALREDWSTETVGLHLALPSLAARRRQAT